MTWDRARQNTASTEPRKGGPQATTSGCYADTHPGRFVHSRQNGGRTSEPACSVPAAKGAGGYFVTTFNDEFYRDILEGLALYTGSALQRDVLSTLSRHDEPDTRRGAQQEPDRKQDVARRCLVRRASGRNCGSVLILGGWFGVLAAVLLHDPRFAIGHVVSLDIDPRCARGRNGRSTRRTSHAGRFAAHTGDMLQRAITRGRGNPPRARRTSSSTRAASTSTTSVDGTTGFRPDSSSSCNRTTITPAASTSIAFRISPHSGRRRRCARCCSPASAKLRRYTRFMLIGRK